MPKLALAFDQFVDWVVDCMFTPAIRTVASTGVLTLAASLLAWPLGNLKFVLIVFCLGVSFTCGLALSMWMLFLFCRYVQNRSMNKALDFDTALAARAPITLDEAAVLEDDTALSAEVEECYGQFMKHIGADRIGADAEDFLRAQLPFVG